MTASPTGSSNVLFSRTSFAPVWRWPDMRRLETTVTRYYMAAPWGQFRVKEASSGT